MLHSKYTLLIHINCCNNILHFVVFGQCPRLVIQWKICGHVLICFIVHALGCTCVLPWISYKLPNWFILQYHRGEKKSNACKMFLKQTASIIYNIKVFTSEIPNIRPLVLFSTVRPVLVVTFIKEPLAFKGK